MGPVFIEQTIKADWHLAWPIHSPWPSPFGLPLIQRKKQALVKQIISHFSSGHNCLGFQVCCVIPKLQNNHIFRLIYRVCAITKSGQTRTETDCGRDICPISVHQSNLIRLVFNAKTNQWLPKLKKLRCNLKTAFKLVIK